VIVQVKLHEIAFPDANESSRDVAAERPKCIFHAVSEFLYHLANLQVHYDMCGGKPGDQRGHAGRRDQDGMLNGKRRKVRRKRDLPFRRAEGVLSGPHRGRRGLNKQCRQ
jgi:hypothetical protein